MHAFLLLVTLPLPWWEVTSDLGARAVSFREKEIIFIDTKDRVRVRSGMLEVSTSNHWEWKLSVGARCVLETQTATDARLTCFEGAKHDDFSLRAAGPDLAKTFGRLEQTNRPAAGVCDKARACGPAAFALLDPKAKFDPDRELGKPPLTDNCEGALKGLVLLLGAKKLPVPDVCR